MQTILISDMTQWLSELEEAAKKATPEWTERERGAGTFNREYEIVTKTGGILFRSTSYGQMQEDAEYIALANPQTILALCEKLRAAEEALNIYADQDN